MCGIAGYRQAAPLDSDVLEAMVGRLYHRGPDSAGFYRSGIFSGGMRRLSINDVAAGDQPLFNEDRSVVLLYNGEIYNYPELRRALEGKGYRFRTHCDGEVVCHLYDEYQEKLFEKLDGMFAIALWIERQQKLILARDLAGEKPLYYIKTDGNELAFASEVKSLRAFPGWDRSLSPQALWDFPTFLWIPEPATVYRNVECVPRGHILVADDRGIRLGKFTNIFNQDAIDPEDGAVVEETRRVVTEAVLSRLLSDVPIGSFLSGGLDSSIVASLAAMAVPELSTFCIAFEDVADPYHGRADESGYAGEMAELIGSKHHTIRVTGRDFREELPVFCKYGDQPFAVSSGLGILFVAKAARQAGIKVLLSGDGADECFGGYSWYFHLNKAQDGRIALERNIEDGSVSFQNIGLKLEERLKILNGYSPQKRAWAWHYYASEAEKESLFSREYFDGVETSIRHFDAYKKTKNWTSEDFIKQDREFYFPFEMLRKTDRMTMAYSVEGRVPFAAPAVLAHVEKLKYRHLVRDGSLKWALREAFAGLLPEEIVRRPKHGFNVPIDHWLRGEWSDLMEEAFGRDSALMKSGIIHGGSRNAAKTMIEDRERLNGHTVFCFIMLNLWLENESGNYC